ncbi:DUF3828 domain-containing protein [Rhabdaerophilum sp. SD176]|uniref:DUF3828 domain-containing protein n=1 Tax=Rhabdaerophilum sp. SD176 TaxID=2983548 RepID=UPI0024DFC01E|nr:DUF3828 domain-containing protein [Rhabdaerophilum sp. SD176]
MNRRHVVLALLAGLASGPAFAQASPADPVAVVRQVYDPKIKNAQRPYSARLRKLYAAAIRTSRRLNEVVSGLDFDPTTNSQDSDDNLRETLKFSTTNASGGKAVVSVTMRIFKEQPEQTLVFELVQEKNAWRIDDIVNPAQTDGWRWSKMLEAGAKGN